jgi:hypothetical protein
MASSSRRVIPAEIRREPTQPNRFEKKKNTRLHSCSLLHVNGVTEAHDPDLPAIVGHTDDEVVKHQSPFPHRSTCKLAGAAERVFHRGAVVRTLVPLFIWGVDVVVEVEKISGHQRRP